MNPPPEPQPRQRRYRVRSQARLDAETHATLEALTKTFHCAAAEIIRQLIAQATLEDFPESWQIAVDVRQRHHARGQVAS